MCVWGACMGHGVIVGEFFPLNMFVLSFHNEQTPLEDKFMSSVAGDPHTHTPALVRPAGSQASLSPRPKADAGPNVSRRRPLALTPPSHPLPGDPRARGGAAPRTKRPPDPTDPRL